MEMQRKKEMEQMICHICMFQLDLKDIVTMESCEHVYHQKCIGSSFTT